MGTPSNDGTTETPSEVERLAKRLSRERRARLESESIAEASIRQLYIKQQELKLLQAICVAANEARAVDEALQTALDLVCGHTGWPIGHVYRASSTGVAAELMPAALWHLENPLRFQRFREVTQATPLCSGSGLPGRVFASGKPQWVVDVSADPNFPRAAVARESGVRAAFAFPVPLGTEVVAVLEFFSEESAPPDEPLLELMAQIGTQLGRVVERERAQETIRWQAYHDALTNLPNRILFQDRLDQVLVHAGRHNRGAAVLFIDLDRFKHINDSLGHGSGDLLLQEVSERLKSCLRAEDTVARMGGDEFTILLPSVERAEDAALVARKLLEALGKPLILAGHEVSLSASVGVSLFPTDGQDADTLLKHADAAMYRTKQEGRNGYQLYAREMNASALERLFLEGNLRKALARQELILFYQPQVSASTGRIIGAEALVRWRHPELGLVPPTKFIPLAEETGLIVPLGEWVLREACRQAAKWHTAGYHLRMSVNLSARQFEQRDLAEMVARILDETGLPGSWLDLELTESSIMARGESSVEMLHSLKELGVQLAMDDFGTGYSSLSYLRRFPLDILKVDRSFVRGLAADEVDIAILRAVVDLAHAVHLEVVAEGVETARQREVLQSLGCDTLQGYLFSAPQPAEEMQGLLMASGETVLEASLSRGATPFVERRAA